MGACDISFTIGKKATKNEILDNFKKVQERDREYNGHQEGYSGDFQTVDGVECHLDKLFTSHREAMDYCLSVAEKWSSVIAVYYVQLDLEKSKTQINLEKRINELQKQLSNLNIFTTKNKYAKCSQCGSKLAIAHMRYKQCPLCGNSLKTATELKKSSRIADTIDKLKARIDVLSKEAREKAMKKNGEKNIKTLVAGWGAC
jgi:hypothetical protein